jgi:hypothetical protein
MRDMTPDEMRPTRFALSPHARGEPIPRTASAARRIVAKGRRLLEAHRRREERTRGRDGRG